MKPSAFWKYSARLFGVPFVVAAIASIAIVLIAHVSLGTRSPGLIALWSRGLQGHVQTVFLAAFLLPVAFNLWIVFRLAHKGRQQGLSWYDYLDRIERERSRRDKEIG